jgi:hypothetical protein
VRLHNSLSPPRYSDPRRIRGIIIGDGIYDQTLTSAPGDFDVNNVPDDFTVEYTYTAPNDISFHYCQIWFAPGGGSVFADATVTEKIYSAPNASIDLISTHDFAPATYNWWITATDIFGNTTAPAGPITLTVTF